MATTFDTLKTQARKPLYAGVGATDRVVEVVRDYVADVSKSVGKIDLEPKALRTQATTVVNARVDALSKDAKARRTAVEKRVAELQAEALAFPGKVQETVTETYVELVNRGEGLVTRIRKQESTKATVSNARTTTAKAKTTKTQSTKATKTTAKKAASTTKKTAAKKSAPAKSSAKATGTAAKKTATTATQAVADAAEKVGD
jgi:hypothetical protein